MQISCMLFCDWGKVGDVLCTNMQLTARRAGVVTAQYRAQAIHVSVLDLVFGEYRYSARMSVYGADFRRRHSLTLGGLKRGACRFG